MGVGIYYNTCRFSRAPQTVALVSHARPVTTVTCAAGTRDEQSLVKEEVGGGARGGLLSRDADLKRRASKRGPVKITTSLITRGVSLKRGSLSPCRIRSRRLLTHSLTISLSPSLSPSLSARRPSPRVPPTASRPPAATTIH